MDMIKITVEFRGKAATMEFGELEIDAVLHRLGRPDFVLDYKLREALYRVTGRLPFKKTRFRKQQKELQLPERGGKIRPCAVRVARVPVSHRRKPATPCPDENQ